MTIRFRFSAGVLTSQTVARMIRWCGSEGAARSWWSEKAARYAGVFAGVLKVDRFMVMIEVSLPLPKAK